jgi:hypothetical protein
MSMAYQFTNPYNFVRSVTVPAHTRARHRRPFVPHDLFDPERLSGEITADLVTRSPLALPDTEAWWELPDGTEAAGGEAGAEDATAGGTTAGDTTPAETTETEGKRRHRRYPLLSLDSQPDRDRRPVIAATSVRGMVRSVLEAATSSCFSVFDADTKYSRRSDAAKAPQLLGGLVTSSPTGGFRVRLLPRPAWIKKSDVPENARPGEVYEAILEKAKHETWQRGKKIVIPYVNVVSLKPRGHAFDGVSPPRWPATGYLKITGPNKWEKDQRSGKFKLVKHHERFFWADASSEEEELDLPKKAVDRYNAVIREQARNYKQEREKTDGLFNSLVPERPLESGDLVYVLTGLIDTDSGGRPIRVVKEIGAVAVPRWQWHRNPGELLDDSLARCRSLDELCPACRLFGLVPPGASESSGYRSRVSVSMARWVGVAEKEDGDPDPGRGPKLWQDGAPIPLAILGAPRPTTYEFYLTGQAGASDATPTDYDTEGARLRGRKFYWHHDPAVAASFKSQDPTTQNRTVTLLDRDNVFRVRVRFANLDPEELGMLIWALRLEPDLDLAHHLGGGRPLGLGSVQVRRLRLERINRSVRYRRLRARPDEPERMVEEPEPYIEQFYQWLCDTFQVADPGDLANLRDLRLMLRYGSDLPQLMRYPPGLPGKEAESFRWFQINRRRVNRRRGDRPQTLPTPEQELGDARRRLWSYDRT